MFEELKKMLLLILFKQTENLIKQK